MKPGEIVLIPLPQMGGRSTKLRPALVLSQLPGPFQNLLLCGVSTQISLLVGGWDELVQTKDPDFATSGLHRESAIRLSYLYASASSEIVGTIGSIDSARLERLLERLADHLRP